MGSNDGTSGTKDISKKYPAEEGTTFETTKTENVKMFLLPTKKSLVSKKENEGL